MIIFEDSQDFLTYEKKFTLRKFQALTSKLMPK